MSGIAQTLLFIGGIVALVILFLIVATRGGGAAIRAEAEKYVLKQEILDRGRRGEATVLHADFYGKCMGLGAGKQGVARAKFRVRLLDTGEEYELSREGLRVPLQYMSDLREGSVLALTVHKDDPQEVVFDFDQSTPAEAISFKASS